LGIYKGRTWAQVSHACNPSNSGNRFQEDHGSKPAWAKSLQDPHLEKTLLEKGLMEWFKVKALSSNSSTDKKKKKEEIFRLRTSVYFKLGLLIFFFTWV
jgi:hypothetical protein